MSLNNNLTSYYKFEGNSNDSTGNYNGTDTNITYGSSYGKIDQGAHFAGNSTISISGSAIDSGDHALTIALWANVSSITSSPCLFNIGQLASVPGSIIAGLILDNGKLTMRVPFTGDIRSNQSVYTTGRHHYAFVKTGAGTIANTFKMYLDGTRITDVTVVDGNVSLATSAITLGKQLNEYPQYLTGDEDEVAYWRNRALNDAEIKQLYNNGIGLQYPLYGNYFDQPYRGSVKQFFKGDKSLKAYYPLIENSRDFSLNGHNGIETSVTYLYSTGKFLGGAKFTGSPSRVAIPDSADFTLGSGDFTYCAWIKPNSLNAEHAIAAQCVNFTGSDISFFLEINSSNKLRAGIYSGSSGYSLDSGSDTIDTNFHFVVFLRRGNYLYLYIDKKQVASLDITGVSANDSAGALTISAFGNAGSGVNFDGYIQEFSFFKRALSQREIQNYYIWANQNISLQLPKKKNLFSQLVEALSNFFYFFR